MEENQVVNEEPTTPQPSEGEQPEAAEAEEQQPDQAGNKTDPNMLLKSLREEREKRRQLEEELNKTKSAAAPDMEYSDEGRNILEKVGSLEAEISNFKKEAEKKDVIIASPVLKDKWEEFEEFLKDNQGMSMKTAAKAFLVENGLFDSPRKGLEKPTGGEKIPSKTGMTHDEVKTLRETNYKKYVDMLQKGQIKLK